MIFLKIVNDYFDKDYYAWFLNRIIVESDGGERPLCAIDKWTRRDEFNANLSYDSGHFLITISLATV